MRPSVHRIVAPVGRGRGSAHSKVEGPGTQSASLVLGSWAGHILALPRTSRTAASPSLSFFICRTGVVKLMSHIPAAPTGHPQHGALSVINIQWPWLPLGLPLARWFISNTLPGVHSEPGAGLLAAGLVMNKAGVFTVAELSSSPRGRQAATQTSAPQRPAAGGAPSPANGRASQAAQGKPW